MSGIGLFDVKFLGRNQAISDEKHGFTARILRRIDDHRDVANAAIGILDKHVARSQGITVDRVGALFDRIGIGKGHVPFEEMAKRAVAAGKIVLATVIVVQK